jgi:hypothetical protein
VPARLSRVSGLCTLSHGYTGFVARAVCHEDLKSIYIFVRDQYTHAVLVCGSMPAALADVGDKEGVGESSRHSDRNDADCRAGKIITTLCGRTAHAMTGE